MRSRIFVKAVEDLATEQEMEEAAHLHSAFCLLVEGCKTRAALNALTATLVALYISTNPETHSRRKLTSQVGAQYDFFMRKIEGEA